MGNWFLQFIGKTVKSGLLGGLSKAQSKSLSNQIEKRQPTSPCLLAWSFAALTVPFSLVVTSRDMAPVGKSQDLWQCCSTMAIIVTTHFILFGPQNPAAVSFIAVGRQTSIAGWRWWEQQSQKSLLMGQGMLTLMLPTPGEPRAVISKHTFCQAAEGWLQPTFISYHLIFVVGIFSSVFSKLLPCKRMKTPQTVLQVCCEYRYVRWILRSVKVFPLFK